ncbi:HEAT repeat-containing protein [Dehalogenimonas formicexedens]|uniref:HEAT repeat-containing protein n=1 Tax=Dehalogenimonas formicexedens TaxID=1839801 RepID=A0A1P8F930_9CHLR|nr:HEAT repeat domain-containing protein [Dehalogenimonas formicexedens]APV44981.1 HEAT repeat-containing protein [Dehalogenimonas formicexedens]
MEGTKKNNVDELVALLDCEDPIQCRKARRRLIKIGQEAVPALAAAASSGLPMKRWEALAALGSIGGHDAIQTLISHLGDADYGIRWTAADNLIKIGEPALTPVLKAMISNSGSLPFRDGAHHFLTGLVSGTSPFNEILDPAIKSLEEPVADLKAPVAAESALDDIRASHKIRG